MFIIPRNAKQVPSTSVSSLFISLNQFIILGVPLKSGTWSLSNLYYPFKYETIYVSFKDPFRTAQKTLSASVVKTDKLMLCREIIAVCSEIHAKHINALREEHRISEC